MKKETNIASVASGIIPSDLTHLIRVARGEVRVGEKKMCEKEMSLGSLNLRTVVNLHELVSYCFCNKLPQN